MKAEAFQSNSAFTILDIVFCRVINQAFFSIWPLWYIAFSTSIVSTHSPTHKSSYAVFLYIPYGEIVESLVGLSIQLSALITNLQYL